MDFWIRAIPFAFALAWVIYNLREVIAHESSSRRFGLSVTLTVIMGLVLLTSVQAYLPTGIKSLGEDAEVAETHPLASLKTGSYLEGKTALSFGYLTERDEYIVMVKEDDGGFRRESYSADDTVVYEDADAEKARVEVVDQYEVYRETHWLPIVGEWSRERHVFSGQKARIHVPKGSIAQGEYDFE